MEKMRENLKKLMLKHGDNAYTLAEKSGVPQPTTDRFLSGKHGEPRSSTVRKWAEAYEITESQLRGDQPIEGISAEKTPSLVVESFGKKQKGLLTITQYDEVGGAMGVGVVLQDQPGQITSWEVTAEWYQKNLPVNTGAKNLKIITGFGNSMQPMFNPGDPLVIDIGVKDCNHDGVFFFRIGSEGFVKTLQRIPGEGIRVISKNPDYESWTIKEGMDFEVLGKVLRVWKGDNY